MALVCKRDRVPLAPTPDGRYQCPECGRVRSHKYWRAHQPDAEVQTRARTRHQQHEQHHKRHRRPTAPIIDITHLGPQYQTGLKEIMERVLAATRDRELVVEQLEALVADRRDGDQGNTRVDEFDSESLDTTASLVLEVMLAQELANLFGLEPYAKRKLLSALIGRLLPPKQARTITVPR